MVLRIMLLFLAILPFHSSLHANWWDQMIGYFKGEKSWEPPTMRVLVMHDAPGAQLEVKGKYSLYDPYTNSFISSRFIGKSRYIQAVNDGLKWGEAFPGLYQLQIRPDEPSTTFIVNGHEYDGILNVYDIGGAISVVNQIPVENYVSSMMKTYEDQQVEPEVLAAVAIIARTHAYFQTLNPKNTYWTVEAQKVGYQGKLPVAPAIEKAVAVTRHMIMSRTGVYEGVATPFAGQFEPLSAGQSSNEVEVSALSLEEANAIAKRGEHAAQILGKAFPGATIMLMQYSQGKE